MTPDMSVDDMLNSFIFIVKGSRVIDRNATDWGAAYWLVEKHVSHMVYSVAELKQFFAQRRSKWDDPFDNWLKHRDRLAAPTLSDAMKFADQIARGNFKPRINVEEIMRNANPPPWQRRS